MTNRRESSSSETVYDDVMEIRDFESIENMEIQRLRNGLRPKKARRVISKSGERNINLTNLPQRSKRYTLDFITTIIDTRWRFVVCAYLVMTFGCWTVFALLWALISYAHNDFAIDGETGEILHDGKMTCVHGAFTWTGYFLYSFEMQTTVGFGERYPNEECPEAIFMMLAQIICGIAIDGAMIGIIYAKLTRPPKSHYDFKFSRKAVVCQRDSKYCLLFRLCDPNDIHRIGSKVQACLFGDLVSAEGSLVNQFQYSLKLDDDGQVHILYPITVCHIINSESPLYNLSAKDLLKKRFEIVVTFTGASLSTGQTTEERTSYLSKEIEWGHRFVNMMEYDRQHGEYLIDYEKFDVTEEIDTPLCSARRFEDISNEFNNNIND